LASYYIPKTILAEELLFPASFGSRSLSFSLGVLFGALEKYKLAIIAILAALI